MISSLTALVLAGGIGQRLRPVVGVLPKALAPVGRRPFIDYVLRHLAREGTVDVVLCTGHGADQLCETCGDGSEWGIRIRCSRESQPLGTGGAIRHAAGMIESNPFLVVNGDTLLRAPIDRLLAFHQHRGARVTVALAAVPDQSRFGSVIVDNRGSVSQFAEKGSAGPGLVNAGMYVIERDVLDRISVEHPVSLEVDVLPMLVGEGLYGMACGGDFIDIGTPESYEAAQSLVPAWFAYQRS